MSMPIRRCRPRPTTRELRASVRREISEENKQEYIDAKLLEDAARYRSELMPPALHVRDFQVSHSKHCHEGQEGLGMVTVVFLTDCTLSAGDIEQILAVGVRKLAVERC